MRRYGILIGLVLLMAACDRGGDTLSLELGYGEPGQLRELRLGIVPEEWEGSADSIEAWTRRYGGRVLSRERQENRRITLELRVPLAQADSLIAKLRAMGYVFAEEVKRATIGQSPATIDSLIRLKEEAIARYRDLLQKARTAGEILEIQGAMSITLRERDSLLRVLERLQVDTGTVLIWVQLVNKRYAGMGAGGSFWKQFGRGFVEGWDLFKGFLILMSYIWWLWLGIALFIWLFIRYIRRSSNQKPSPPRPPENPA